MRAVIQRVRKAAVTVSDKQVAAIGQGFLVLLGVGRTDEEADAQYIADKVAVLRVFEDAEGKMNLSVQDIGGAVLVVSQFTLFADSRKGRRPSFIDAADPEKAQRLYHRVVELLRKRRITTEEGIFQASMQVELTNDGPVTILLDSKKNF